MLVRTTRATIDRKLEVQALTSGQGGAAGERAAEQAGDREVSGRRDEGWRPPVGYRIARTQGGGSETLGGAAGRRISIWGGEEMERARCGREGEEEEEMKWLGALMREPGAV